MMPSTFGAAAGLRAFQRPNPCQRQNFNGATEPLLPEQLPWPRNLFGELASIAELMAESAGPVCCEQH
jgi:hypothetical protein